MPKTVMPTAPRGINPYSIFPPRKIARRKAAQSDADGDGGLQKTAARGGDVQDVAGIENNVELQQRAEEEKICVPKDGEPQDAVLADQFSAAREDRQENWRGIFSRDPPPAPGKCRNWCPVR